MQEKLSVTIVQSELHWEDRKKNLEMFAAKLGSVMPRSIVLLPEMFSTGFSMEPAPLAETMTGDSIGWMKKMAAEKKIVLCGSLIIEEEGRYYNRFVCMLPNGEAAIYDKRHLFAYAGENEKYTAGNRRQVLSISGWKIQCIVCYDLRFPVWTRQQMKEGNPEYDVLLCVANWPEKRIHAWKTLLQARAIENQCYVAAVNRTGTDGNGITYSGESLVIDPLGNILETHKDREIIFSVDLERKNLEEARNRFPFLKDADKFLIMD